MKEFNTLFETFRVVFTAPSYLHFQAIIMSLWALPTITGGTVSIARIWLRTKTTAHWDALMRFLRRYRWSESELAKVLTLFVLSKVKERLPLDRSGKPLLLIGVDETTDEHIYAKRMFGVSKHHNHSAKAGQSKYRIGHCWVTLSILTDIYSGFVRSLAINIALYVARKSCPKNSYHGKRELATQMLDKLDCWVGDQYEIVVVGDAYYACRDWITKQRSSGRRVVTRMRADANLRQLPPAKRSKKPGRPKTYGPRIDLRKRIHCLDKFEPEVEAKVYGGVHKVRLRKIVCLWYRLKGTVSVVIVLGIGKKPVYLLDTDPAATALETLYFYAARHAVEQGYQDLKCDGGLGHYRGRTELGVRRFALLAVVSHTLLRLIELIPELRTLLPEVEEPWRKELSHLTCGQIRLAISKLLLERYAETGNFLNFGIKSRNEENCQRTKPVLRKAA
jgi:hypothetical protein